jgi:predicted N-acyltransferase
MNPDAGVIEVLDSPLDIAPAEWNGLLSLQDDANPFMRHEYLAAMHQSDSAIARTGWTPRFITLWKATGTGATASKQLQGACALYIKNHSYGEYVFDHAWANAYHQHGLAYYPKALIAPPFTPVPGARLLARDPASRLALVRAAIEWSASQKLSSLHILFASDDDLRACEAAGMMVRHNVQFHWTSPPEGYRNFEHFLASLSQDKRKKIRQERRKVTLAGVDFRTKRGTEIFKEDWDFFYRCYERTYYEHGNAPYLSRSFFRHMASDMPQNWLLFIAQRGSTPIASSLLAVNDPSIAPGTGKVAYGRYWGALERVDCLHFEACYYQPLEWCIANGFARFEGGAQGEHKMARALLPVKTRSAHWLAHPAFSDAVQKFLDREGRGMERYVDELEQRNPFRTTPG